MSSSYPSVTALSRAETVAVELLRALRGRRSRPAFSRHLGYQSNVAQRWERRVSWPSAPSFFSACARLQIAPRAAVSRFLRRDPAWLAQPGLSSVEGVAALLTDLRGRTPIGVLAERTGHNRFSVSRWLKGTAVPRLPELLNLIDASTRRLPDFVSEFVDPARLPTLAVEWQALSRARAGVFERPWSHAVLRALELGGPRGAAQQAAWIARKTGLSERAVQDELTFLASTQQAEKTSRGYRAARAVTVDTGGQAERALALKLGWARTALDRIAAGAPGHIGYSLFSVSRADMLRIRQVQLEFVRTMSAIIARSEASECVGLYSAQLLDLAVREDNVFADHEIPAPAPARRV